LFSFFTTQKHFKFQKKQLKKKHLKIKKNLLIIIKKKTLQVMKKKNFLSVLYI